MGTKPPRRYSYAALGMLLGTVMGGGVGVIIFAITGNAVYIAIAGAGTAIGLVLGAGFDRAQAQPRR